MTAKTVWNTMGTVMSTDLTGFKIIRHRQGKSQKIGILTDQHVKDKVLHRYHSKNYAVVEYIDNAALLHMHRLIFQLDIILLASCRRRSIPKIFNSTVHF